MPKVNRMLVTSIIDDINELVAVSNEMCSWMGNVDHLSWRYPTRCAKNVNAIAIVKQQKGSAGEMYILILEMAYDRMHFVLRLVLEFFYGYPFIEEFFKEVIEAKRPKSMTVAKVIQALWQRLKLIPETVTRNMIKTKHLENSVLDSRASRGCQASGPLLSSCESCSMAEKAIIDLSGVLSSALQEMKVSSVVVAERETIRSDIFDKTQWAAMTKFVEAMTTDVKTLLETTASVRTGSETRARECEKSVRSLEAELEKQKSEISSLEFQIRELTARTQAADSQLQRLKFTHQESVEESRTLTDQLREVKEKASDLENLLVVSVRQGAEMAESKVALEKTVGTLSRQVREVREVSSTEKGKLLQSLEHLREENILSRKQHLEEVQNLKDNHAKIIEKFIEDARILAASKPEVEFVENGKPDAEQDSHNSISNGDPEIDMAKQFASNKKTIEKLTRQNERLSRTLTRLREYRKVSRTNKIQEINETDNQSPIDQG